MAIYSLENEGNYGGDYWEKKWWHYLKDSFPNYERFWQSFIAEPLTARPRQIHIREGLHPLLEEMAMAHYSVFYHIAIVHWLNELNATLQQNTSHIERVPTLHAEVLFHLSTATEMIERLMFIIWKIAVEVGKLPPLVPFSNDEELEAKIKEHLKNRNYLKDLEKFKQTGQSVNIRLHSIRDIQDTICDVMTDASEWKKLRKKFNKLVDQKIRRYRNILAHNPLLGNIESQGTLLSPTPNMLGEYSLWSSMFYNSNIKDFIPLESLITKSLKELIEISNGMWDHLIDLMDTLSHHKEYQRLLGNPQDNITTSSEKTSLKHYSDFSGSAVWPADTDPPFTMPSGTSSIDPTK